MSTGQLLLIGFAALLVIGGRELHLARFRVSLNRALHEVRRPLQVLAMDSPAPAVKQAIRAVGQLDRTLNGGAERPRVSEPVSCRLMADACVRRWLSRAHLSGAGIELDWTGPDALVRGDGIALCGALENLIVNAIEHGGPLIRVKAHRAGTWVRIEVVDSGCRSRPAGREDSPAATIARQRGAARHGHGLAIARRTIEEHGGRLELDLGEKGSRATVILPRIRSGRATGAVRVNW